MALKKKVNKVQSIFKKEDFNSMGVEYLDISSQIKVLEARKKELAEKIKQGAESLGVKDDKGSFHLDTENCILGKIAKKSVKVNSEKGKAFLTKKGLTDCIKEVTEYVVDEKAVEEAVKNKKLTMQEVEDNIMDISTSYSVSVSKKEEISEVSVSSLSAARKK